jgi:hypothetical protein
VKYVAPPAIAAATPTTSSTAIARLISAPQRLLPPLAEAIVGVDSVVEEHRGFTRYTGSRPTETGWRQFRRDGHR